ncbi:MAG: hypothetical protein C5B52_06645, partial [Bacteroidetes bacterium]
PIFLGIVLVTTGCYKDKGPTYQPNLIFRFKFDSTQARLNNMGEPSTMPPGNAGQSPVFNSMSAHYIELSPDENTPLGKGTIVYRAPETTAGGDTAIDFSQSIFATNNEVFYAIPLSKIQPGDYQWARISLAYQNYSVQFHVDTVFAADTINQDFTGTVASFIGFNTYLTTYTIKTGSITVNGNRKQGYWGFETVLTASGFSQMIDTSGQAPEGATTVPNPIFATSPIPPGSCVVTAAFVPGKLTITGTETKDIIIEISLSTNKSFEWIDLDGNGMWDPLKGEQVVDMGIRGMIPTIQQ